MKIRCPTCSTVGNVPEASAGRRAHCPLCAGFFVISEAMLEQGAERRRETRKPVEGAYCDFGVVVGASAVKDISTGGLALDLPEADVDFTVGQRLAFSLHANGKEIAPDVVVEVVRVKDGFLGCRFVHEEANTGGKVRRFLEEKAFRERLKEADDVVLEMDEKTIELKARGYL